MPDPVWLGTNRYAYAGNDPVNKSDPNGHFFAPAIGFVIGVIGSLFGGTTYANTPASAKNVKSESQGQQLAGMAAGAFTGLKGLAYARKGYEAYSNSMEMIKSAQPKLLL